MHDYAPAVAKYAKLSEKQLAVLQWVADGRPKGVYEDGFDHRITARALERRGLLSVRGHGPSWRATITEDGRYYLAHDDFPPSDEPLSVPKVRSRAAADLPPAPVPIADLIGEVVAAAGVLRIETPSAIQRISYRRAVEAARAAGEVAAHQRLKLTGTKHGPLVIELVQVADPAEPTDQIPVPAEPDSTRPEIRELLRTPSLLAVSDQMRPRTLALVQGMADECIRRGWHFIVDGTPSFLISVGEDEYRGVLTEEREKRDVFAEDDIAARKYDWQRVSPTRQEVFVGRLRLEVGLSHEHRWWADRRRWTLASKLPDVFAFIDEMSSAARAKRDRLAAAHREHLAEWEVAVPRARERYLRALNAERAAKQIDSWRKTRDLREYAEGVEGSAMSLGPNERGSASAWATWLRQEADRFDPLAKLDELRVDEPVDIPESELDKYMPKRWTVRRPPEPPTWLPS